MKNKLFIIILIIKWTVFHLEGVCGRPARLHPHRRDLCSHWSTCFCINNTNVRRVDDDADDRRTGLLCRVKDDQWPETKMIKNQYQINVTKTKEPDDDESEDQ